MAEGNGRMLTVVGGGGKLRVPMGILRCRLELMENELSWMPASLRARLSSSLRLVVVAMVKGERTLSGIRVEGESLGIFSPAERELAHGIAYVEVTGCVGERP